MPEHVVTRAELHETTKRIFREHGVAPSVLHNADDTYTVRYETPDEPPVEVR